jgi:hypothetical protein
MSGMQWRRFAYATARLRCGVYIYFLTPSTLIDARRRVFISPTCDRSISGILRLASSEKNWTVWAQDALGARGEALVVITRAACSSEHLSGGGEGAIS